MSSHIYHDSPKKKKRFIGAMQAGQSLTGATNSFNIPKQTTSDLWKKLQKMGLTHAHPRSGCPSKISARMNKQLSVRREPIAKSLHEIGKFVTPNISASSVRTILHEVGLHRRKACKVVYLHKDQKESRKCWAKDHRCWTTEDCMQVIWSDECYIYIEDDRGTVWVTWVVDEEFDENCVILTLKQSSLRVMIWACIMKGSKGPMVHQQNLGKLYGSMEAVWCYKEQK